MEKQAFNHALQLAVLDYIQDDSVVAIGSSPALAPVVAELASVKHKLKAVLTSSKAFAEQLQQMGVEVLAANDVISIDLYIDTANAVSTLNEMVKADAAALTQGRVFSAMATKTLTLVNPDQKVALLGRFPIPVEVIPMARSYVARELIKLGADPSYRENGITDNGNIILDLYNLEVTDSSRLTQQMTNIAGVVGVGLFQKTDNNLILIASATGVETI